MNAHPYRWTIVGIGALMTCVALGAMFSLAIFLEPLSRDTGGWIFDRFGGYSWLFFASLGLAVGAMAIAFAFPRATQPQLQPA